MFRAIASEEFPPFGKFRLDLPSVENKPSDLAEVHLFTGVNGTGKTRLLAVLAAMLGGPAALQKRSKGNGQKHILRACAERGTATILAYWASLAIDGPSVGAFTPPPERERQELGSVFFRFQDPALTNRSLVAWAQDVPAFAYTGVAYVADSKIEALAGVAKPERKDCLGFSRGEAHSAKLQQAISNFMVQAAMDSLNDSGGGSPPRSTRIRNAVEAAVAHITGTPFTFKVSTYPQPNLQVKWGSTLLPLDMLPDGLRSIIGWLVDAAVMLDVWLEGRRDPFDTEVVFLLDEIESHLHPAWQRKILPAFQRLFPKAQIFVATHSPFVIASLNVGWIHRLTLGAEGWVKVEEPIPASAGDSYVSVVEDIMGLQEWYDPETEQLLTQFRQKRDAAYRGDAQAQAGARDLATTIGKRSMELDYLMSRELSQMDRQLAKATAK